MDLNEFKVELEKLNIIVTDEKLQQLEKLYTLMISWNQKINLTRITEKKEVYLKHYYDSLTLVKAVDLNRIETLCDVGSGAGFPGLILKIFYPELKITLIDSLRKRVDYLNLVIKELNLKNIIAIHSRAEDIKDKYDIVTARAVANIDKLLLYTMHLLNSNGQLVAMKGNITEEFNDAKQKEISKKYNIKKIIKFKLPLENSDRSLIVLKNLK